MKKKTTTTMKQQYKYKTNKTTDKQYRKQQKINICVHEKRRENERKGRC